MGTADANYGVPTMGVRECWPRTDAISWRSDGQETRTPIMACATGVCAHRSVATRAMRASPLRLRWVCATCPVPATIGRHALASAASFRSSWDHGFGANLLAPSLRGLARRAWGSCAGADHGVPTMGARECWPRTDAISWRSEGPGMRTPIMASLRWVCAHRSVAMRTPIVAPLHGCIELCHRRDAILWRPDGRGTRTPLMHCPPRNILGTVWKSGAACGILYLKDGRCRSPKRHGGEGGRRGPDTPRRTDMKGAGNMFNWSGIINVQSQNSPRCDRIGTTGR